MNASNLLTLCIVSWAVTLALLVYTAWQAHEARQERRELYNRLTAGTLQDYAAYRHLVETVKESKPEPDVKAEWPNSDLPTEPVAYGASPDDIASARQDTTDLIETIHKLG